MATVSTDTNLSAVSYAQGETIEITSGATLTMDSTPSVRPGTISCTTRGRFLIANNSTTTPIVLALNDADQDLIFTGNGSLEIQGQMIVVYTGNGNASQTISFSSINGALIDYPSFVEVETGSGTNVYRPWYVLPTTGTTGTILFANLTQFGAGVHGNVCLYSEATRTLTFGDGTNGNVVPSGARVRIPNAHITSAVNVNSIISRSIVNLNPSGVLIANNVSFSNAIGFAPANFKSFSINRVGAVGRSATIGFAPGSCTIRNFVVNIDPRQATTGVNIGGLSTPATLENLYSINRNQTLNLVLSSVALQSCTGLEAIMASRTAANHPGVTLTNVSGFIDGVTNIGGRLFVDTCSNLRLENIQFSDQPNLNPSTLQAANAVFVSNSNNTIVSNLSLVGPPPYNSFYNIDAGSRVVTIKDAIIDGANHCQNLLVAGGSETTIANITFNNSRVPPFLPVQTGNGLTIRNVQNNQSHAVQQTIGSFLEFVQAASVASTLPNYNDSNPFAVLVSSPRSTGQLIVGTFGPESSRNLYTITGTEETDWFFNNNGVLFVVGSGIVATFRSAFPIRSITSFQNVAPTITGTNTNGFTIEFRLSLPGSISGASWLSLTESNLISALSGLTGYDSDEGFDVEVRFTSIGVDAARSINLISIPTNNDDSFAPKVGSVPTTVTNGIDGSVARLYDRTISGSPVLLGRETISSNTATLLGPYDFDGATIPATVRISSYTHNPIKIDFGYQNLAQSFPLAPEIDASVTETNRSTVQAYSHANTLERCRDLLKDWKDLNFDLAYPALDTPLVAVNGPILDFGALNIIFDGTAVVTRTVNTSTNTVTFKLTGPLTGTRYNSIETDGTISFVNGAQSNVQITDSAGTRYNPLITIANFPNGSKITIIYGGVPIDVALNQNAPYSYRFRGATPATATIQVERSGFEKFTQDVPLALADVTVFAVLPALEDADSIDGPDVNFRKRFAEDAAALAILRAADADASLREYVGRAMILDFEVLAWKDAWNAIVSKTVGTTPTLTDVNRWRAYATETGYSSIVFRDTPSNQVGEVV